MKKRIGIFTKDNVLYNKLRLLLREVADVVLLTDTELPCDIIFADIDTSPIVPESCIKMSRTLPCDMAIPFRHEDALALVESSGDIGEYIVLGGDGRHAYLGDEKIKLTELEYKLLGALISADGDFVTRQELLSSVWGEGFDAGVVNVYVHYLRQKLEKNGKKIILSSRKEGYGIDKKYRRDR